MRRGERNGDIFITSLQSNCTIPSLGHQFLYKVLEHLQVREITLNALSVRPYEKMGFIKNGPYRSGLYPMIANFSDIKKTYDTLKMKLDIKIVNNINDGFRKFKKSVKKFPKSKKTILRRKIQIN
jgi:hypothetical protein